MSAVPCTCEGAICGTAGDKVLIRRYKCSGCKRKVPWCFGAADDAPNLCDDCWGELHRKG